MKSQTIEANTKVCYKVIAAAALIVASGWAQAVTPGTVVTDGPVVNPFNGKQTDVWRLVGKTASSAFQITREWVISSAHSPAGAAGFTFKNANGESATLFGTATCSASPRWTDLPGRNDFFLCRLKNPENLAQPASYPPLSVVPALDRKTATKYGSAMAFGRGNGDRVAFVGLNGLPYGYVPLVDPLFDTLPIGEGNDSGGALYWFSPTTNEAAAVGVITTATIPMVGSGTYLFTDTDVQWIAKWISDHGDTPPVVRTTAQHYGGTTANPAPELSTPPVVSYTGTSATITWTTPSGATVDRYSIAFGPLGTVQQTVSVPAGNARTMTFNGLGRDHYMACVQPINSVGPATPAWLSGGGSNLVTPNCRDIDTRLPMAPAVEPLVSTRDWLTGQYRVSTNWLGEQQSPWAVKYRVVRTETASSGAVKTYSSDFTATSGYTYVPKGTTVCVTVYSISDLGVVGLPSAAQCKLAG
jgi:hypothetical protein